MAKHDIGPQGDLLEWMSEAIKNSDVVVICYNAAYCESVYCKSEANMSFQNKKHIIPIKMEGGLECPDWLNCIIASYHRYDFYTEAQFSENIPKIIDNILLNKDKANKAYVIVNDIISDLYQLENIY